MKWAHALTFVKVKGQIKFVCSCGKQGKLRGDSLSARLDYDEHVGLSFKREKK